MSDYLSRILKDYVRKLFACLGLEIKRLSDRQPLIGSDQRPVGRMDLLLEDLRIRGLRCEAIMDVGANRGNWSRMAKTIFPDAQFTLIEPLVEMKESLECFCADFPGSSYFLAGAGAREGMLTLTVRDNLVGSSFLPAPNVKLRQAGSQREILIVTIDDLIDTKAAPVPELMKLDVQGFELEVLKGASSTFGRTAVYIVEVSFFSFDLEWPVFHEVVDFMQQRGYVVYDFGGFMRRPLDGALGQCDICFVQEKELLRFSHAWN